MVGRPSNMYWVAPTCLARSPWQRATRKQVVNRAQVERRAGSLPPPAQPRPAIRAASGLPIDLYEFSRIPITFTSTFSRVIVWGPSVSVVLARDANTLSTSKVFYRERVPTFLRKVEHSARARGISNPKRIYSSTEDVSRLRRPPSPAEVRSGISGQAGSRARHRTADSTR